MWIMTSVYDNKAEEFTGLYLSRTIEQAMRSFSDFVLSGNNQVAQHPADYELHDIGTFDEQSGQVDDSAFSGAGRPSRVLCTAEDCIARESAKRARALQMDESANGPDQSGAAEPRAPAEPESDPDQLSIT